MENKSTFQIKIATFFLICHMNVKKNIVINNNTIIVWYIMKQYNLNLKKSIYHNNNSKKNWECVEKNECNEEEREERKQNNKFQNVVVHAHRASIRCSCAALSPLRLSPSRNTEKHRKTHTYILIDVNSYIIRSTYNRRR